MNIEHDVTMQGCGIEANGDVTIVGEPAGFRLTLMPAEALQLLEAIKAAGIGIDLFKWDDDP